MARASFSEALKQRPKRWREGARCLLAQGLSRQRQGKPGGYSGDVHVLSGMGTTEAEPREVWELDRQR